METKIHTYTSREPMLKVNAFIVETTKELVIVDTTLTMSDSIALKKTADQLAKPIAGIVLTHAHPDHIAGTTNLSPDGNIPLFALASVKELMMQTEQSKHQQWSSVFGKEWIPKWIYPNEIVKNNDTVNIAGLKFTVLDIGAGGDCDANSLWYLEDTRKAVFAGDFLYKANHSYLNDGSILRWLGNLERYAGVLKQFETYYVGHGSPCNFSDVAGQREYLLRYCANVLEETGGTGIFTDETRKSFEQKMLAMYPDYSCQFMIALSADRVGKELTNPASQLQP